MNRIFKSLALALLLIFLVVAFSACDTTTDENKPMNSNTPQESVASDTITNVSSIPNTTAIISATLINPTPSIANSTIASNTSDSATNNASNSVKALAEEFLPPLDTSLRYFGIAEYAHVGSLSLLHYDTNESAYIFNGEFRDGTGIEGDFAVKYYINYTRGTLTEQAWENTRTNKKEVNSKLHNLVVLMLPVKEGDSWFHSTYIDGKMHTVYATVTDFDGKTAKVEYRVPSVPGYYNNTYIEQRTYEKGYGMTGFANLLKGDLDISDKDAQDEDKLQEAMLNNMFGYQLAKSEIN